MDNKNLKIFSVVFFLLFCLFVGGFYFLSKNKTGEHNLRENEVLLKGKYPDKIVYYSQENNLELAKKDCEERKGEFAECGSDCSSFSFGEQECSKICQYVCSLEKEEDIKIEDDWKSYENQDFDFSLKYDPKLNLVKREEGIELLARNYETRDFDFEFRLKVISYGGEFERYIGSEFTRLSKNKKNVDGIEKKGNGLYPDYYFKIDKKNFFVRRLDENNVIFVEYLFKDDKYSEIVKKIIASLEVLRNEEENDLTIFDIETNQVVKSPLFISGIVRSDWIENNKIIVSIENEGGELDKKEQVFSEEDLGIDSLSFNLKFDFVAKRSGSGFLVIKTGEGEEEKSKSIEVNFNPESAYNFGDCVKNKGNILQENPSLCQDGEGDVFIK